MKYLVLFVLILVASTAIVGCNEELPAGFYVEGVATGCDAASAPLLCSANAQAQLAAQQSKLGEVFVRDYIKNHRTYGDSEAFTKLLVDLVSYVKVARIVPVDISPRRKGDSWYQLFKPVPADLAGQLVSVLDSEELEIRIKEQNLEQDAELFRQEMENVRSQWGE